jgi:hypothetical protein
VALQQPPPRNVTEGKDGSAQTPLQLYQLHILAAKGTHQHSRGVFPSEYSNAIHVQVGAGCVASSAGGYLNNSSAKVWYLNYAESTARLNGAAPRIDGSANKPRCFFEQGSAPFGVEIQGLRGAHALSHFLRPPLPKRWCLQATLTPNVGKFWHSIWSTEEAEEKHTRGLEISRT